MSPFNAAIRQPASSAGRPRIPFGRLRGASFFILMKNQTTNEDPNDSNKRLDGRCNVAAKTTGRATSTEINWTIVEESGKDADRFLYRKIPLREGGFIGHSIQLDEQDQVQTRDGPVEVVKTSAGAPPDSSQIPWSGSGVAGDQMVFWQDEEGQCHYTQIQDMPSGDEIRSEAFSNTSLEGDLSPVSSRIKRPTSEDFVEVTTREGMSVKMLRAHGLLTVGDDGRLRKIQPGEIVEGETLVPRAQPKVPFGTGPNTLEMRTKSGRGKQLDIRLGRGAGFVFGTFVADGSTSGEHHRHVLISGKETEIQQRTAKVYKKWGLNPGRQDNYISTTSAAFGRTLVGKCGKRAENKRIPDFLWTAPPAFRDGFISGYFSGDGTVSGGEICATTVSRELAEGMVFLLGSMGIRASYNTYEITRKDRYLDQHLINIYQSGIENFPALALDRKQKRALKVKNSETKFSRDRIPVPEKFKTETVRALRENDLPHQVYTTKYASRPRLKQVYGDLPDRMQELVDAPIWWEVVESVEEAGVPKHVYDLEIRGQQDCMVAGGLLARSTSRKAIVASRSAKGRF